MRILISNDDGIRAPGLKALVEVAREFGEVKITAPEREKSGCGHGMTLHHPLRAVPFEYDGLEAVMVDGVPVDCVNVGLTLLWPDGCDLVLSGFNNGPNLGFDVTYSGTVAAALEGAINHITSISLSIASFVNGSPLHYETGTAWLLENFEMLVNAKLPPRTFLNVNVPNVALPEIQGHRAARMGNRVYEDRVESRLDPWGRPYYWQGGVVVMRTDDPETDVYWVSKGYVSITPIRVDWTDDQTLASLRESLEGRAAV